MIIEWTLFNISTTKYIHLLCFQFFGFYDFAVFIVIGEGRAKWNDLRRRLVYTFTSEWLRTRLTQQLAILSALWTRHDEWATSSIVGQKHEAGTEAAPPILEPLGQQEHPQR